MPETLYHLNDSQQVQRCGAVKRSCPFGSHMTRAQWASLGKQVPLTRDEQWQEKLETYKSFRSTHNREPFSGVANQAEAHLYDWLKTNRKAKARDALSDAQQALLNHVNPTWAEPRFVGKLPDEANWQKKFDDYKSFWQLHARDPKKSADDPIERKIAVWIYNQRQTLRGNNTASPTSISPARQAALATVNPDWNKTQRHVTSPGGTRVSWQTRYEQLCAWLTEHEGLYPRATAPTKQEQVLGSWLHIQRQIARGNSKLKMTEEQHDTLNMLDPNWSTVTYKEQVQKQNYAKLEKFLLHNGRAPRPTKKDPNELNLFNWLKSQLNNHKNDAQGEKLRKILQGR